MVVYEIGANSTNPRVIDFLGARRIYFLGARAVESSCVFRSQDLIKENDPGQNPRVIDFLICTGTFLGSTN